jgi:hypothetical protein
MNLPQEIGQKISRELEIFAIEIDKLNSPISLDEKLNIWQNHYSKIEIFRISLDFLKASEIEIKKLGIIILNQFSEYFVVDVFELNNSFEKNNFSNDSLKHMFSEIFEPINSLHFKIKEDYKLNIEILPNSEFSTLWWGINKTLEELNFQIIEKIKQIEENEEYYYTNDKKSEKAFNLGFLALNKNAIFGIPNGTVFKSKSDFKRFYFPTFNQTNTQAIFYAKKLFEIASSFDSNNISAKIFCIIAEIEFYQLMQEEGSIILLDKLKEIYTNNPSNGFAAIELAYAYATFNDFEKTREYIDLALTLSDKSVYIYFRAAKIFSIYQFSMNCSERDIINLLHKALQIDPENHIINYEIAQYYLIKDEIATASLYINKATLDSNNLLNRDILTLKSRIHYLMPSYAFKPGYYEEIKEENSLLEYALNKSEMVLTNQYIFISFDRIEFLENFQNVKIFTTNSDFEIYPFKNVIFLDLHLIANSDSLNHLNVKIFTNGLFNISNNNLILKKLNVLDFF